jgi:hypothetical protein
VIGSQEACNSIGASMFKPSKQRIIDLCKVLLGPGYFMVHSVALQATHLVVFASLKLSSILTDVKSADLALGFNNSLGNKGACKIAFKLGNTSLCFLTAHLHSG